ncbi:MAG: rhodanese-like domain-containing protein [Thiotrichales bacterium]
MPSYNLISSSIPPWRRTALALVLPLWLGTAGIVAADSGLKEAINGYLAEQPIENLRIQPNALQDDPRDDFYFVFDVRPSDELSTGLIKGAVHAPYYELIGNLDKLPASKDDAILVYCDTGPRSTQVVMALRLLGYSNVWYLNGGVTRWQAESRPLVPK